MLILISPFNFEHLGLSLVPIAKMRSCFLNFHQGILVPKFFKFPFFNSLFFRSLAIGGNGLQLPEGREFENEINLNN